MTSIDSQIQSIDRSTHPSPCIPIRSQARVTAPRLLRLFCSHQDSLRRYDGGNVPRQATPTDGTASPRGPEALGRGNCHAFFLRPRALGNQVLGPSSEPPVVREGRSSGLHERLVADSSATATPTGGGPRRLLVDGWREAFRPSLAHTRRAADGEGIGGDRHTVDPRATKGRRTR